MSFVPRLTWLRQHAWQSSGSSPSAFRTGMTGCDVDVSRETERARISRKLSLLTRYLRTVQG